MPKPVRETRPVHAGALSLVALSATFGVIACTVGALGWGLLGLAVGLVGAWVWFLAGLVLLYRRERRSANAFRPASATTVDPEAAAFDQA